MTYNDPIYRKLIEECNTFFKGMYPHMIFSITNPHNYHFERLGVTVISSRTVILTSRLDFTVAKDDVAKTYTVLLHIQDMATGDFSRFQSKHSESLFNAYHSLMRDAYKYLYRAIYAAR